MKDQRAACARLQHQPCAMVAVMKARLVDPNSINFEAIRFALHEQQRVLDCYPGLDSITGIIQILLAISPPHLPVNFLRQGLVP